MVSTIINPLSYYHVLGTSFNIKAYGDENDIAADIGVWKTPDFHFDNMTVEEAMEMIGRQYEDIDLLVKLSAVKQPHEQATPATI